MGSYLNERFGDPVVMIKPAEYATDVVSSATYAGVPIRDAGRVLFILTTGDLTTDSLTVNLEYSSTGTASDGGADTDVWASSNMVFTALDSDGEGTSSMIDLDIGNKGMTDADGKFFGAINNTGGSECCLIGIPYDLKRYPATNAVTVIER